MPNTTGTATDFITFSRASLATVVDADGKLKWAPHNLLHDSESFDASVWSKTALSSVVANATAAPNSTATAETIVEDGTLNNHLVSQVISVEAGVALTLGVFVKRGTGARQLYMRLVASGGADQIAGYYDLGTGVAGAVAFTGTASEPTLSITSVGNGWFYATITGVFSTTNALSSAAIGLSSATTNGSQFYTGDNTSSLFIWGAHLYRSDLGGMQANATVYPLYNPTTPKNAFGSTESFGAGWTAQNATVSSNTTISPNGIQSASTLTAAPVTGQVQVFHAIGTVGTPKTISVYLKAGTYGIVQYRFAGDIPSFANFDLINGVTGTSGGSVTPQISAVGNGWYRCSIVYTSASGTSFYINMVPSASSARGASLAATGTETVHLWGAQLSSSASVDPYSRNDFAAPVAGAYHGPRRDFDPVTLACRGLLVEEQRTNSILYSNDFSNVNWFSNNMSIVPSGATSPDGTNNGNVFSLTGTSAYVFQSITVASGVAFTASVWIKGTGASIGKTARLWIWYAGTATGSNSTADVVLTSSWQRVSVTSTPTGSGTVQVRLDPEGVNTSSNGDVVHVYGAQAETNYSAVNPYPPSPSSYIPTSASTVTRSLEYASISPTSIPYSTTEGSIVIQCSLNGGNELTAYRRPFSLEGVPPGGYQIGATYVYDVTWRVTDDATVPGKHGVAFKTDDHAVVANGGAARTGTGAFSGSSYNILRLGSTDGNWYLNGHIRNITYIPRRLTNAELQARTA